MIKTTIQTATSRGQITLPAWWRKQYKADTNHYLVKPDGEWLKIKAIGAIDIEELLDEQIIFDADRDNNGKGLPPEAIIEAIDRTNGRT